MVARERPGRPLKFENVEDLETRIELYFQECDKECDTRRWSHDEIIEEAGKKICAQCFSPEPSKGCMLVSGELKRRRPYTVTGLAVWLDTSRRTLLNYECKPEFFHTITRAKQRIENYGEESLFDPKLPTRGVMFSLSNNSDGWAEKKEDTVIVTKDAVEELADLLIAQKGSTAQTEADAEPEDPEQIPA